MISCCLVSYRISQSFHNSWSRFSQVTGKFLHVICWNLLKHLMWSRREIISFAITCFNLGVIFLMVREVNGKYVTQSDHWSDCCQQYPMTAAYRFTDYSLQGQTLPYVTMDIAKLPLGGLDLFNLYVALSWSLGCETIQLLHDFDD